MQNLTDKTSARIQGWPTLYAVPARHDPADRTNWVPLRQGRNIICVGMHDAVHNLLLRNFEDWQPTTVALGYGGDYDQPSDPDTTPPSDQGSRQAPSFEDTYVRKVIYRAPIVEVKPSALVAERRTHYISIIRPDDGNTDPADPDRPFINEFGLEAANGTLLAHYVTPADVDSGISERYAKSSLEWLVVDWEIEYLGSTLA